MSITDGRCNCRKRKQFTCTHTRVSKIYRSRKLYLPIFVSSCVCWYCTCNKPRNPMRQKYFFNSRLFIYVKYGCFFSVFRIVKFLHDGNLDRERATPFHSCVVFRIEIIYLNCTANQIAGFYKKYSTGLKWVKKFWNFWKKQMKTKQFWNYHAHCITIICF